jgi:hypothetical protein
MITRTCDRCGRTILEGELRYVAKLQVFAAYDPLKITFEDLLKDHQADIDRLIKECEGLSEAELMRQVHVSFDFDLCPQCQREYVAAPLGQAKPPR